MPNRSWGGRIGVLCSLLMICLAPAWALAAPPEASFTATVFGDDLSGQDCVAPCFVFVDAQATDDPDLTREFHELDYRWDFGDPDSGFLRTGGSANNTRGPLAGHMYETPGTYTISLVTVDPDGEASTTSREIVVQDPLTFFAGSTYCVSRGSSFGSWCPAGATRVGNQTDFNTALEGTPNVDQRQVWVVVRCGEEWGSTGAVRLHEGTTPGLVSSRADDGGRCETLPRINYGSSGGFLGADSWTVSGLLLDGPGTFRGYDGGFTLGDGDDGFVVHRVSIVDASGGTVKVAAMNDGASRLAVWGSTLEMSPNGDETSSAMFWMGREFAIMNTLIDNHLKAEFNLRFTGARNIVLTDSEWARPGYESMRNAIQIRGNDSMTMPHGQAVIRRNLFSSHGNSFAPFLRFCRDAGCHSEGPEAPIRMENIIVENNHMRYDRPATLTGGFGLVTIQAGEVTVRNNTIDLRGVGMLGGGTTVCNVVDEPRGGGSYDNVHCFNNTLFADDTSDSRLTMCSASVGTGHRCYNNLVYTPNRNASFTAAAGNWQSGGNVYAASSPFAAGNSPGVRFQTNGSEFALASSDSLAADRGVSIAQTFANALPLDFDENCRQGTPDVGAFERGSSGAACPGGGAASIYPRPALLPEE